MSPTSRLETGLELRKDITVQLVEPPSCSSPALSLVFVGRNRRGQWVAQEQNGLYGGLFVNRSQAIKYALAEKPPMACARLIRALITPTSVGNSAPAARPKL